MKMKHWMICAAAMTAMQMMAYDSAEQWLTIDDARTPFWRTALSSTETLALDHPEGSDSATLVVTAAGGYSATCPNLTGKSVTVTFPDPISPETERVYTLTLTYSDGTVRTATLTRVLGSARGATASGARCIPDETDREWRRFRNFAVLPVPYGTTSLSVNGGVVDTGLDGAAGWYGLGPVAGGETVALQLASQYEVYAAAPCSYSGGVVITFR